MRRGRGRSVSVLAALGAGALLLIATTQSWFTVTLSDSAATELELPGADAVPLLAPLSLVVLALAAVLALSSGIAALVEGLILILLGAGLTALVGPVVFAPDPVLATAVVTEATGLAGEETISSLVAELAPGLWPSVALVLSLLLIAVGLSVAVTWRAWSRTSSRYRAATVRKQTGSRPHDHAQQGAIESWDDLSRGEDPTG